MNAGYVRLSRDDDKRNYVSIENQKLIINQYASDHGMVIDRWYEDDGVSGYIFDRPGFQQMMADLDKDIDTVYVKDFSRLGRHNAKVLLLLDEFQERGKLEMLSMLAFEYLTYGRFSFFIISTRCRSLMTCGSQLASSFVQLEFEEEEQERQETRLDLSTFNRLKNIFDVDYIDKVEEIVLEAEKRLGYTINEISYVNLITHLLILIKRIKSLSVYTEEESEQIFTINTIEKTMAVAHFIASEISKECDICIPDGEIKYIHQYLVCSGIQSDFLHLDIDNYSLDVKEEYLDLVNQMISFVSDLVHFDLRQDKELKLSIITHFIPMVKRIQYHVKIENPLIHEIKSKYSGMFSIVTLAIEILHNDLLNNLNDDEIGFLTIHFQAALERSMEQKQVIIVCPEGIGFSRLIANRIERFISSVHIVDIVSLSKISMMDLSKIDFIISTVPIQKCEKTVVLISSFLSEFDIRDINNYLIESSQNLKHHNLEHLLKIIDETVVFVQLDFQTKEEVLKFVCHQMYKNGYVTKEYQKTVFEREAIMSTDLGNRIAIPHGNEKEIIESRIAIITLKKPILWDQHHVDIIFLIAMNMKNPQKTKNILKDLYSIMDSKKMLEELVKANSKERIIQCIRG